MSAARTARLLAGLLALSAAEMGAQAVAIPLTADRWSATDSIRFERYLGRDAMYLNTGAAVARGVDLRDGTIEFDMAATPRTNFMGVAFHARTLRDFEVIFFRVESSGTMDAVQYAPARNGVAAAWQIYRGAGANAIAELPRERWIPVKVEVSGDSARLFLHGSDRPTLVVPYLAAETDAGGLGVWLGGFGRGAYFSNVRYTPAPRPVARAARLGSATPGTIMSWRLSSAVDAATLVPGTLPALSAFQWENVRADATGIVLVNRFRQAPAIGAPTDSAGNMLRDSVMTGRVRGARVVLARFEIDSDRERYRRMHFGYSDGVVIYCNGQPLFFGMDPPFFRDLGVMARAGDAVYLPLRRGKNEIVLAVTEFFGGWAYWARLDP